MGAISKIKKSISISIVLVFLSLIGFVILQVSWVYNLKETQKHRVLDDVERSIQDVAKDLAKQQTMPSPLPRPRSGTRQGMQFQDLFSMPPQSLVTDHFTQKEIDQKIHDALNKHDVGGINIEYGIFNGPSPEAHTRYFMDYFLDSSILKLTIPIVNNDNFGMFMAPEAICYIIPNLQRQVLGSLTWSLISSGLFTLVIIMAFYTTIKTMLEQSTLSKVKTDFINNMTHEFKTPIATISLAVDALQNPKVFGNAEKMSYFNGIIKEENKRMNKHVETILQAASMERQELQLNINDLHIHDIVHHIVDVFTLQLQDKNGQIVLDLDAKNDLVKGDDTHINNLINNLVDNAVKYSNPEVPLIIRISTSSNSRYLTVKIEDNGIGMSKETVKRVFERFYRAHTGNIHNVKGFGLGMSYVKTIIEAHHGKIKVDSTLGKGSVFTIELPIENA
ncbi:sensor histidine kinase [Rhizosphaericola mali]|uniref:histidine kinase n=1 Tax=Rhizosphaericola mali TaxID=2545455 RepID=A0A5P2G4I0_9BACT|nr:HAMP domain-containing sensor histidine kinase [Rhizosphaericola mali]QES90734.1 HAMP domain-containing histidine kinase [Rhizosphaericola mali]